MGVQNPDRDTATMQGQRHRTATQGDCTTLSQREAQSPIDQAKLGSAACPGDTWRASLINYKLKLADDASDRDIYDRCLRWKCFVR